MNMHTTNLRKVGGSVMMAVPPALLDLLHIGAGAKVGLAVDNGRLVVDPQPRPRYTLDELLAQCVGSAEVPDNDRTWLDDTPTGDELI
jgi:antitoxin ChpS